MRSLDEGLLHITIPDGFQHGEDLLCISSLELPPYGGPLHYIPSSEWPRRSLFKWAFLAFLICGETLGVDGCGKHFLYSGFILTIYLHWLAIGPKSLGRRSFPSSSATWEHEASDCQANGNLFCQLPQHLAVEFLRQICPPTAIILGICGWCST